jgi:hypothetical protein
MLALVMENSAKHYTQPAQNINPLSLLGLDPENFFFFGGGGGGGGLSVARSPERIDIYIIFVLILRQLIKSKNKSFLAHVKCSLFVWEAVNRTS